MSLGFEWWERPQAVCLNRGGIVAQCVDLGATVGGVVCRERFLSVIGCPAGKGKELSLRLR